MAHLFLKKKKTLFFFFLFFLFSFFVKNASADVFYRNLSRGSSGTDVKILQFILNNDPETLVSVLGPGSKGKETDFLGKQTIQAVDKMQKKFGILGENGWIGPKTRLKLEQILKSILNKGFSSTPASSEKTFSSRPKTTSNVSPSFSAQADVPSSLVIPSLSSISPTQGGNNIKITITGKGFLAMGNDIYTIYTTLKNLSSSDGKTITFDFDLPVEQVFRNPDGTFTSLPGNIHLPVWITVVNKNGISNSLIYDLQI